MTFDFLNKLLAAQQNIMASMAMNLPLKMVLEKICLELETILAEDNGLCSILLLDKGIMRHGASPHIPNEFTRLLDGVEISQDKGACSQAMYLKTPVFVDDIENSLLWGQAKDLARLHNFKACWSMPILSSNQIVLGSFAVFYPKIYSPNSQDVKLLEQFSHLCRIAIEHDKLARQVTHNIEKFSAFTNVMPDLALILAEDGTYVDVYGADENLLYAKTQALIGHKVNDILPPDSARPIMDVIERTLSTDEVQIFEYQLAVLKGLLTFEGRTALVNHYDSENPDKRHILWMARDISQRKNDEQKIEQLAYFDALTNLPNRRMLKDRLSTLIEKIKRENKVGALLYLDLDDFKRINDSLGHAVGDELLIMVANRIRPLLRNVDTFARLGGDEFVVMLDSIMADPHLMAKEATFVAQKLIKSFDESFNINTSAYKIGVSIGISLIAGSDTTSDSVLMHADTAMYRAKKVGGSSYSFFDPGLQRLLDERLKMEQEILASLVQGHFCAYFQPQVAPDGQVIGAEALIRWLHPQKGMISPVSFIAIAEQFGIIRELQDVVIYDSCQLMSQLKAAELVKQDFSLSINISASQFKREGLLNDLLKPLQAFNLDPKQFKLEITESMLIDDIEETVAQMLKIKAAGFRFSIDDFGTGYSSLTYLHKLPIDELKIDKSFVDKILESEVGLGLVDTIIAMSNFLKFNVIVEGAEQIQQVKLLNQRPIKAIQGYYYARPMTAEAFLDWLKYRQL